MFKSYFVPKYLCPSRHPSLCTRKELKSYWGVLVKDNYSKTKKKHELTKSQQKNDFSSNYFEEKFIDPKRFPCILS